ncbi:MAG: 1-deoxy-D-xylulose-5-phosphate synthase [Candidatus Schekmanbacteria bacterium RIFCSPHIGHO2_02_FULL_38_11]|uniref:1-deoxy-D-xylulose-5-phosphate synthase n=1 Tax=Candidatus Schekmanbacteria bacterium RIFCSPLOWO2_12_FULL_38_15 TaxID=1817883 RepID=A0A1F7SIA3_9BACT|nr:MAG: 1-deoxy-D-xylulose-5-phosphate synthase [Candidatus Schekmanbacteria bacterium RIFCSPLOWO2_02_FULL_38_14]OGL50337.1 MAG: 1-deoxy-D-xylulose-5-phosphate synthase [Candidatus Schekmanbacteria bacterium RIFCSPHIGHO2_02_FULL_38_11]OGL52968.1 MAG: 1-deoxy-D-xylulose-5-phosphate synthase [Candidatus Schekmanbacteria bacterium RIFCSPLOWO2_12_FULL_38_15]
MEEILKKINYPNDLKEMTLKELDVLASEIRELIIKIISQNGGHLASSLGVVELTIALHYVFNAPDDKIVWDVGHQSYAHKILTGRKDKFSTIRKYKGLSGFPHPEESIYDPFTAGHASTSISVSLGIAEAMRHLKEENYVIAVVGDGSLTGGLAYEGLNHAGRFKKNFIVVLNDNEMSISPNVGAIAAYLSKVTTGTRYMKFRKEIETLLKSIPKIGTRVAKQVRKLEEAIKSLIVPGIIFEELGFKYVGPIDGHNIHYLIETLKNVKEIQSPVLIHVITQKGKGYKYAEENPCTFHGVTSFEIESGCFSKEKSTVPSYTQVFGETVLKLAEKDERVVAVTAAMAEGTGLCIFRDKFPERFYDVGIAEQHGITFAAGMASKGLKPIVAIYSTFLQRGFDQIIHDVCIPNLPVIFAIDRAGIVGSDGVTHQGVFDISYLRFMPNMIVMSPKDENELQHMLYTAINMNQPVAIRYPRSIGTGVVIEKEFKLIEVGKAEVIKKGKDVALLAIGNMVYPSLCASEKLEKDGIRTAVVNSRFIKPLDRTTICNIASEVNIVITIEENVLQGGFGSAVLEILTENGLANSVSCRIGIPDEFVEHGSQVELREKFGLDTEGIIKVVRSSLGAVKLKVIKK